MTAPSAPVLAIDKYASNADLIVACRNLGYLRSEWATLDPTYGLGTFWKRWKPNWLECRDIDPAKAPGFWYHYGWVGYGGHAADFTALDVPDRTFDAVVFDCDYKLTGTHNRTTEDRYGLNEPKRWQDRMADLAAGTAECARVLNDVGCLLVKCQDQVCSGAVRWQTDLVTRTAEAAGLVKIDRLDFLSYRPQPSGTRQVHARRNSSQLLVFRRPRRA